ncbi:carbohydrate ABC transporter permease [Herbivorax sp. ANBcel31]|uniref:carbohydrate ABC transporter permease n=1 Tax=Herbivorax sp. ANBcel31 TaxID=3069754 RepID=UPI0027B3C050|nr:carbohydrate ABC transporter permease [Herbivorax sp. ANBcel31]MDQ2086061.1 carbohydrate ABC transporter permease [Herbivorax sp. ANBcel31]
MEKFKKVISKFKIKTIFTYTALSIWALINIFPLYWLFTFSLKSNSEIFGGNVIGLPKEWMWSNFHRALTVGNVSRYFINSVIVTGITIVITVIFAAMATYALTRLIWKGRKSANNIFMLGLTIPIHAAILPIFVVLSNLKMLNTYQALIVPYVGFALAMAILIFSGFMAGIPKELDEAACIDGCSVYGIFFRIILPLLKPAISTVAIFTYLQAWNELMFAVVFIRSSDYRTLTVGIQSLEGTFSTEWGPIGAALLITTIPTLILYAFMSKKIQKSLMEGAIKG